VREVARLVPPRLMPAVDDRAGPLRESTA